MDIFAFPHPYHFSLCSTSRCLLIIFNNNNLIRFTFDKSLIIYYHLLTALSDEQEGKRGERHINRHNYGHNVISVNLLSHFLSDPLSISFLEWLKYEVCKIGFECSSTSTLQKKNARNIQKCLAKGNIHVFFFQLSQSHWNRWFDKIKETNSWNSKRFRFDELDGTNSQIIIIIIIIINGSIDVHQWIFSFCSVHRID